MNWIQSLSKALGYIEMHLTDDISIDEISAQAYSSSSHFQLIFHLVMGMTVGEYIRNRRLSCAAQELLLPTSKISDTAFRYRYDTQESFSKAFTRFHGVPPSNAQRGNIRLFHPLTINITVQGGFDMSRNLIDDFVLLDVNIIKDPAEKLNAEAYKKLISWAGQARGRNPSVFDALTEWMLDDSKWTDAHLEENEWIFMQGVLARFKEQNAKLRGLLKELEPLGVVNAAVFKALDRFDNELSGQVGDKCLRDAVEQMFADFSVMKERCVRQKIAGFRTGPTGTDTQGEFFGFINFLKDCDAGVQWTLFMPDVVERQQDGFRVESFEYRTMPAMRFIGKESHEGDCLDTDEGLKELFNVLEAMSDYKSDFDYDILFMHHYGRGVDIERWHGFWGRFMKADTPVPEGFVSFDHVPQPPPEAGPPYYSRFAYATFSGDMEAMHKREGYDSDAMYDVTRNIILGQGVNIPYPSKYWTAEVFFDGCDKWSTGYLFSACE